MDWYPNKRLAGLLSGLVLLVALLIADLSIIGEMLGAPVDIWLYLRGLLLVATLPLLAFLAYGYYGLINLTYRVERNGILIRWAAGCDMVPMAEIREIVPFARLGRRLVGGVGWPGYRIGRVRMREVGPVRLYITRPASECLLIRTRTRAYLISPGNVEGFLADYRARRRLGPIAQWDEGLRLPALLDLSIRHDRWAGGVLAAGLALNVGLFGYLTTRYASLPLRLVLSYDLHGQVDRIGARTDLFILPAAALGILLLNAALAACLHRRERVLALALLCNSPLVQALVWLATLRFAR